MSRPIGQTLAGLIAVEPTAAQFFQPQQADDATALALNPHLTRARRRELAELAASRGWEDDLISLATSQTGPPDNELGRLAARFFAQQSNQQEFATLVERYPALLPLDVHKDLHDTVLLEESSLALKRYRLYASGGSLRDAEPDLRERLTTLSWTVDDDGHPWHLPDDDVVDWLRLMEGTPGYRPASQLAMTRLLRRPAVQEWLAAEARKGPDAGRVVAGLAHAAVYSPYLPADGTARRRILRCAAYQIEGAEGYMLSPLVTADDLEAVVARDRTLRHLPLDAWGARAETIVDVMRASSRLGVDEARRTIFAFDRSLRSEWAVAAEAGSPYVEATVQSRDLGVVTRDIGVRAAEQLLDKYAVTNPEQAAGYRQHMAEQGWAHPLRHADTSGAFGRNADHVAEPLAIPARDLHSDVWPVPNSIVKLPAEITGLLDTPEAWERLAHVAEQYPDQPLGAALLLARDTVAVPA